MRRDSAPALAKRVSPANMGALAALIVLLGALALFLIGCDKVFRLDEIVTKAPNYYTCECECTNDAQTQAFAIGVRVRTLPDTNIRETPAGTIQERALDARLGTTIEGPVQADLNGNSVTWWRVDFEGATPTGWVSQNQLRVQDVVSSEALEVCLPAEQNTNVDPTVDHADLSDVTNDCATRVQPVYASQTEPQLPPGSSCNCKATKYDSRQYNDICDAECTDPYCTFPPSGQQAAALVATATGVVAGESTAAASSSGLFTPTSVCEVTGEAVLSVPLTDGGKDTFTTAARGVMHVYGGPCVAGEECRVGISYELTLDDIEISVRFHSDPKFVDLGVSGVSEPLAAELAPFLPLFPDTYVGVLPTGTMANSARGRRSSLLDPRGRAVVGTNPGDVGIAVDWVNKRCLISGAFVSQVVDDDGNTAELGLTLDVGGAEQSRSLMVNQPPHADAGPDQTVECTSPEGAPVTLNAAGSSDADGNISFFVWRRESEDGLHVADPSTSPTVMTQQALGEATYWTRVVDTRLTADGDSVKVTVADSTPAVVSCSGPEMVQPPKSSSKQPVTFTAATAADTCGAATATILDYECFEVKKDGRLVRKEEACVVQIQGDTISILETGGVNTVIKWRASATDAAGNASAPTSCEVLVTRP